MAAPATITVFDNLYSASGVAVVNATVYCVLNGTQETTSGGLIQPTQQVTTTDGNGRFAFSVVCNDLLSPANSTYTIITPFRTYDIAPQSANGSSQQTTAANVIVNTPVAIAPWSTVTGPLTVGGTLGVTGLLTASGGADYSAAVRVTGGRPWYDPSHPALVGASDDVSIQNALTAAGANPNGGEVLILPFKVWVILAAVIVPSMVTLRGIAWATVLRMAAGANLNNMIINAANVLTYAIAQRNLTLPGVAVAYSIWDPTVANNYNTIGEQIRDLVLDGNAANQTAGTNHGINFNGGYGVTVDNIYAHDLRKVAGQSFAVRLTNCPYLKVSRVTAINTGEAIALNGACYAYSVNACAAYNTQDTPFAAIADGYGCPVRGTWDNCIFETTVISGGFDIVGCCLTVWNSCEGDSAFHHGFDIHTTGIGANYVNAYLTLNACIARRCGVGQQFAGIEVWGFNIKINGFLATENDNGCIIFANNAPNTAWITFWGGAFQNSQAGPGIFLSVGAPPAAATNIKIIGTDLNDLQTVKTQTYAIFWNGANSDYLTMVGCTVTPNATGVFNFAATPLHISIVGSVPSAIQALTDGATINTDASLARYFTVTIGGTPRTIAQPTNWYPGAQITYELFNNSGGVIATTWAAAFLLAGAWTDPAAGRRRKITFTNTGAANSWLEDNRTTADI